MAVSDYGMVPEQREYRILNEDLVAIGTLRIGGKTEFFGDTITHQVADADQSSSSYGETPQIPANESNPNINAESKNFDHSGSISVVEKPGTDSDKIKIGNCLAYFDEPQERWYVMKIWDMERSLSASGAHIITAQLVNLGLWDLHYRLTLKKSMKNASAKTAFYWLLQDMDWNADFSAIEDYTVTGNVEFNDHDKSSAMLQTLLQQYNLECDFYVEYKGNYVTKKIFQVAPEIDSGYYGEAYVGQNVTALSQHTNGDVITRLTVVGPNGETMAKADNYTTGPIKHVKGYPYVYDEDANAEYSDGVHWLDGVIITNDIKDAAGLMTYGAKILKMYNHPRVSYTLQCTHTFNPKLGATVRTKDFLANPEITTYERVISKTFSFADPSQSSVSFGEFVTVRRVTPAWLANYTSVIQQALDAAKDDASNITVSVLTPDGTDFKGSDQTKRFYIQAWSMGTNISGYISNRGFEFLKYQSDTISVDGTLDDSLLGQYEKTLYGYSQVLTSNDLGSYRAQVDNDYLTPDPEIYPDQTAAGKAIANLPHLAFGHKEALQYAYRLNDGSIIGTYSLEGLPDSLNNHKDDCALIHFDTNGNVLGSMRIASGGHGSCFGVQEVSSEYCYVYMNTYNLDDSSHKYRFTRIKFYLTKVGVKLTDNKTSREDFKIGWTTSSYFYTAYDNDSGYCVIVINGWHAYTVKLTDLMNGKFRSTQTCLLTDYGWNPENQTWQSVAIKYPYVFWHSGDYDMHDRRVMYGINMEHKGQIFEVEYNFLDYLKTPDGYDIVEPESLSYKNGKLLVSFNCAQKMADVEHKETLFEIPLVERKD